MNMITADHTHSNKLSINKLSLLNKLFKKSDNSTSEDNLDIHQLQLATCILLIEVSKSDDDYDKVEQEKIISLIKDKFSLTDDEIEETVSSAGYKAGGRVGLESGGGLGAIARGMQQGKGESSALDLMTIKATLNQIHTNNDDGEGGGGYDVVTPDGG